MNILALAFLVLSATAVNVQGACGPHDKIAEGRAQAAGEVMLWSGILKDGGATMEIWVNPNTGTWSELRVDTNGIACFGQVGEGWGFGPIEPIGVPS